MVYNIRDNNIEYFKRYYWVLTGIDNSTDYLEFFQALRTADNSRMGMLWITRLSLPISALILLASLVTGPAAFVWIFFMVTLCLLVLLATFAVIRFYNMKTVRYYSNLYWDMRVVPEGQED